MNPTQQNWFVTAWSENFPIAGWDTRGFKNIDDALAEIYTELLICVGETCYRDFEVDVSNGKIRTLIAVNIPHNRRRQKKKVDSIYILPEHEEIASLRERQFEGNDTSSQEDGLRAAGVIV